MKIKIDNRDLENVHIDTYQMLTGDSAEEMLRDYEQENGREDYETVDIDYDHNGVVKDFAMVSIDYLSQQLTTAKPQVVKNITYISHGSPKFYNYTTDYYVADYDVNIVELHNYIAANYDAVIEKVRSYKNVYSYTPIEDISKYDISHAGVCHYIDSVIERDDYNMALWECENEIYYEHSTVAQSK